MLIQIIKRRILVLFTILSPFTAHASFIESTIGTAVVNDATATYHNPAALTLINTPQIIGLGNLALFSNHFSGTAQQVATGFSQSGNAANQTHFYLPSVYLATPFNDNMVAGIAVISNFFNRELEQNSILRYAQSSNTTQNIDLVSALGIKLNSYFSIGAGINLSQARLIQDPIAGAPSLLVPDNASHNESKGTSWGGDVGVLYNPSKSTLMGFNYRNANTYHLRGTSVLTNMPQIASANYRYTFWVPARSVFSINHFVSKKLGLIGTVQWIQWSIFKNLTLHDFVTQIGGEPRLVSQAAVPYFRNNSWVVTLGTQYRLSPQWIFRMAGTYNQSPGNSNYQITNGDSVIWGGSVGYDLNKHVAIDASYAHAFIGNSNIHIIANRNIIAGVNRAERDSVSLKLTIKGLDKITPA